ncbi:aspartic peptidase domain-containing protein [Aspergillus leporis]|jgi:hypothetical protein|uniref:Aspartic peptidase domain-containing protein n=1 Tax=Aspergillus leporis TaxID=41062 RepID=A0A5N5XEZ0_9EURO|nr:aspartic peptidase domain-containing protein [Aspergillus leporis]
MKLLHLSLLFTLSTALVLPLNRRPRSESTNTHTTSLLATKRGTVFDVDVAIGSNNQTFKLLVDTGSSDTYIVRENFSCLSRTTNMPLPEASCNYGPKTYKDSPTYQEVPDETFGVQYGDGIASGVMAYETITLADVTVRTKLGIADTSTPMGDGVNSGVLGLGYPCLTSAHPGEHTPNDTYFFNRAVYAPVFNTMFEQGKVEPYFSVALAHTPLNRTENGFGGYLTLGDLPPVERKGEFVAVPVEVMHNVPTNFTAGRRDRSYWAMTISAVKFGDAELFNDKNEYGKEAEAAFTTHSTAFQAFVDTGNDFSYLPAAIVDPVNARFEPPAVYNEKLGLSVVDCAAKAPVFGIELGGQTFYHQGEDLIYNTGKGYCVSGLVSSESVAMGNIVLNILGVPFLKNVVAVFDFARHEMRFART